nr:hypothetical protein [Allomuricauda sp.]
MKKHTSANFLFLMVISLLVIGSCSKDEGEISYNLTGNWKVAYYMENGKRITKVDKSTWPDINNGDITANFSEPDNNGAGTISGITVSNAYNGEYVIQSDGKISIGPISTTFINEPEWTELFNINAVQNFEIRHSELFMSYNSGRNIIVLERNQ